MILLPDEGWTTRFAPSPTGFLHLGHLASALVAFRLARDSGGRFLLRLEDIDATRCRAEYATAAIEDLDWLGIVSAREVRRQSAHFDDYRAVLDRLRGEELLYPCFCTRAAIAREVAQSGAAPHAPDGALVYPGTCRGLSMSKRAERIAAGVEHAWRLDMRAATARTGTLVYHTLEDGTVRCDPVAFGDVVLARREVPASYHLCVTHDDALQGVSLVTRGEDLRAVTDIHRVLQALMGWAAPVYHHHPLLREADGRRLAKRDGAQALRALRAAGWSAEALMARADLLAAQGSAA